MEWSEAVTVVLHDALCALRHTCLLAGCKDAGSEPTGVVRGRVTAYSAAVVAALQTVRAGMLCDDCFAPLVSAGGGSQQAFVRLGVEQLERIAGVRQPEPATSASDSVSAVCESWCGSAAGAFFGACEPVDPAEVRLALANTEVVPDAASASSTAAAPGTCAISAPPQCALHGHAKDLWSLAGHEWVTGRPAGFASSSLRLLEALQGQGGIPTEQHLHGMVAILDEVAPLTPSARRALSWLLHDAGVPSRPRAPHCERPDRIRAAALGATMGAGALALSFMPARLSSAGELLTVHSAALVDKLRSQWETLTGEEHSAAAATAAAAAVTVAVEQADTCTVVACPRVSSSDGGDMFFTLYSLPAALLACGGALEVTAAVLQGRARNGVALVRSPGHHATPDQCMGFCLINSAAVAARMAVRHWGARRVAIVDWDVHHGNGTQDMFEEDPDVLYMSLHRYDAGALQATGGFYPGSGSGAYAGRGHGRGTTVNVPWPGAGVGDAEYEDAFQRLLLPVLREYGPDVIFVSAGFDAALYDPLGGMRVSPGGYAWMTHALHDVCLGRVVVVLEGGYNLRSIALSVSAVTQVLTGKAVDEGSGEGRGLPSSGGSDSSNSSGGSGDAVAAEDVVAHVTAGVCEDTPSSRREQVRGGVPALKACLARYTGHLALHGEGGDGDVWTPGGAVSGADCAAAVDACIGVQRQHWSALSGGGGGAAS